MTLVMGGAGAVLCLVVALLLSQLGALSTWASRAQLAADAAALAAVAESAPYGQSEPATAARSFAEANGARLLECDCDPETGMAQVEVVIGDAVAAARAVLDPEALAPVSFAIDGGGLHPALAEAVRVLVQESAGAVRLVSGRRSRAEQRVLWSEALIRYGSAEAADDWVARPGTSAHERGVAVDLGGDLGLAVRLIDQLGLPLHRPLGHEPWHFELSDSPPLHHPGTSRASTSGDLRK
jgi:D-alanyl-D-alanine carboxypeptidase